MTHSPNDQNGHPHADDPGHDQAEEQAQIAREIGEDLTEAFVAYVRGDVSFDDLVFGVFDALSDLNVVASGEYELEDASDDHDGHDHA